MKQDVDARREPTRAKKPEGKAKLSRTISLGEGDREDGQGRHGSVCLCVYPTHTPFLVSCGEDGGRAAHNVPTEALIRAARDDKDHASQPMASPDVSSEMT